jgi:glycosyltransferase involved in cell wall biosynthesis
MARILTLTNWYPPHHFGGYEVLCDDVMSRLAARGHEVEVLCSNEVVAGTEPGPPAKFPVHRLLQMYWRDGLPWTPPIRSRLQIERDNNEVLRRTISDFKPDVVSVWHMGALSLSLLTTVRAGGVPMLYSICDEWLIYGIDLDPWSRTWFGNPFRRTAGRLAQSALHTPTLLGDLADNACVTFLSAFTRTATRVASPWHYPVDPVIYPGIDRSMFPPPATTDDRPWGWNLLYTSRLEARKGADTLLRAMTRLPEEATLSMLGRGDPAEQVRLAALAQELGLADRVRFEAIGRDQLARAYSSHDCFIFPSEWPEPFGMVPLEAMACGTPVVATGVGGSGEFLVDEANCLHFPPGDDAALAEAILRVANDPGLRRTLRANGWISADQFDLASTVDAYEICHLATANRQLDSLSLPPHPSAVAVPLSESRSTPSAVLDAPGTVLDHLPGPVLQIGHGTRLALRSVTVVGSMDAAKQAPQPAVVGTSSHLPLRSKSFATVVCTGELERVDNDQASVRELARVAQPGARLVAVTPNRHNLGSVRRRLRDRWRGWSRTAEQYYAQPDEKREYTWAEIERLLAPEFSVERRVALGWGGSPKRRLASRLLVGPLRAVCPNILLVARAN